MKSNRILEKITELYIFIIIILFPLLVDKTGFFKILECKYRYYLIISITYLVITTMLFIYYLLKRKITKKKNNHYTEISNTVSNF